MNNKDLFDWLGWKASHHIMNKSVILSQAKTHNTALEDKANNRWYQVKPVSSVAKHQYFTFCTHPSFKAKLKTFLFSQYFYPN